MSITQTISALPTPPTSTDPTNFSTRADAFVAALPTLQTQFNIFAAQANSTASDINGAALNADGSRQLAQSYRDQSSASASAAQQAALAAQGYAMQAGLATNVPLVIFQPRRLTTSLAVPDGQNAHTIGPFEVDPSVTVQGIGNATWTGL